MENNSFLYLEFWETIIQKVLWEHGRTNNMNHADEGHRTTSENWHSEHRSQKRYS